MAQVSSVKYKNGRSLQIGDRCRIVLTRNDTGFDMSFNGRFGYVRDIKKDRVGILIVSIELESIQQQARRFFKDDFSRVREGIGIDGNCRLRLSKAHLHNCVNFPISVLVYESPLRRALKPDRPRRR